MIVVNKIAFIAKAGALITAIAALSACGGSSDDSDNIGYVKFYNASYDSPSIFMTLDEDLDSDDDDEFEQTFSSVAYGSAGSRVALDPQSYYLELAWQNEDSSVRSDLEIIIEDQLSITKDSTQWLILTGSIQSPQLNVFDIPIIDDDEAADDADDDLFNIRFVNLDETYTNVDVYFSDTDETFAEATLITSLSGISLSDNFKLSEDQYKVYITEAGSTDVLFTAAEIDYSFGGQYLIAIRENQGVGGSPFVIDNMSNTRVTQYDALESKANVSVYNGLDNNDLVDEYNAEIDVQINGTTAIDAIDALAYGEFSEAYEVESGDYRFTIINDQNDEILLQNRVLSLAQNTNKTLFLYWTEEEVDDDGDGNVDENEDGVVDEIRPVISSLLVDNSSRSRLYDKELTLLNLVNSDDFSVVSFYFVKSDEIIDTAENSRSVVQGTTSSVILLNNTYQVFVIAEIDNNDIIIDELTLTLDEESKDQFLLLEHSDTSSSGFALRIVDQVAALNDD
ncbi:MAG: hypothetical protein WA981_02805 [Glaciecola sp.]